jgi:hypothetical protein
MSESTRSQLLDSLQHNWGELVAHFRSLPPHEQEAWLAQQGYARLADLLAHVIAWWDEAMPIINRLAAGEEVEHKEYDEDRFNAEAVGRFAGYEEAMVLAAFEAKRKQWVALISELPDSALAEPLIADRLRIELIRHYQEHTLAA